MELVTVYEWLAARSVYLGVLVFVVMLVYKIWRYAFDGLRRKKIAVWSKNSYVTTLKGRPAVFYALFWVVVAVGLSLVLLKFVYLFVITPESL